MDNIKGVLYIKARFEKPNSLFCESINEILREKQEFSSKVYQNIEKINGWKELVGATPLYGFMMQSGDYLLIESIEKGRCEIFILWLSNIEISDLLASFVDEINRNIFGDWKRTKYYQIPTVKLKYNDTEKVVVYPSFEGKEQKIDLYNEIKFLNFRKQNKKIPRYKIVYNFVLVLVLVFAIIFTSSNSDSLYLVIGILIPIIISVIEQIIDWKCSSKYAISVDSFRISNDITNGSDANSNVSDPE